MTRGTLAPTVICEPDLERAKARALEVIQTDDERGPHFSHMRVFRRGEGIAIVIHWRQP